MSPHAERIYWPVWCHLLIALPCILGLMGVVALLTGAREASLVDWITCLLFLGIGWVWWRMRYFEVQYGPEGVAFGFGGLRRKVPADRIVTLKLEEYAPLRYMGWGYRIGWRARDRAYSLIGTRTGIRLEFTDARDRTWSLFLATRDPEEALRAAGGGPDPKKDGFC